MEQTTDVIIVGGGVMGCALAYNLLKRESHLKVRIIERDSSYKHSSTALSDGNTRIQFNLKENIQMSQYGLEVMATFAEEMATRDYSPQLNFRQQGNLFVVDEAAKAHALEGVALQKSLGCAVEWLKPDEIKHLYPPFEAVDCAGATFGPLDGTFSPLDMLLGYRRKAEALGAVIIEAEAVALIMGDGRVQGVKLAGGELLYAPVVANTTGAWARFLVATAGIDLPVVPIKRQVFIVETNLQIGNILPMLLLPQGEYLFHEGAGHFVIGASLPDDPETVDDFSWSQARFEERLWEGLVKYLPTFDRLRVVNGWAGLYAVNSFDGNAILGEWPQMKGLYLANGFSGHGLQQAHAVGRYLAESILDLPHALDLSIFSPQRILDNTPVFENPKRLI